MRRFRNEPCRSIGVQIENGTSAGTYGLIHAMHKARKKVDFTLPPKIERPTIERTTACPPTDARQCRIWLNEARREIDLLRGGLAVDPATRTEVTRQPDPVRPDQADQVPKDMPEPRRLYAPKPIGEVDLPPRETPPPAQVAAVTSVLQVTNLGTLLDVLA